jgi:tetratricopeptide (TPR) repeat protein
MVKNVLFSLFFLLGTMCFLSCNNNPNASSNENIAPILKSDPVLAAMTEAIQKSPKDARLYFDRGNALHKMNLDTLAIKDFKKAAEIDTNQAAYYSAVGDLLFEKKDITGSVQWIQKAISKNPKDYKARLKIAKLCLYIKKYSEAISQIDIVLRSDAFNPEAYFLKGMVYKDMKDTAKALSSFLTSVQVAPEYRESVIQLGLLYSAKGDSIALKYLDNAYKIDTGDVFPVFARGVFFQEHHNYDRAKQAYRECIFRDRHYANAYFNLGIILTEQDSLAKALRHYDIITKFDPLNVPAIYNRGVLRESLDSVKEAVEDYKLAYKIDPSYTNAKDALKRLKAMR